MDRNILIIIIILFLPQTSFSKHHNYSKKEIQKLCIKVKNKITMLEKKARQKSTAQTLHCLRAYSDLRYQYCHMHKYREKIIKKAKNCKRF